MKPLSIALAQLNTTVGDIAGNVEKIRAAHAKASAEGADIVLTPELSVVGYAPEDLVLMPAFRAAAMQAVEELAAMTKKGAALIVGSPWEFENAIYNAAVFLDGGKIVHVQPKTMLPNYSVFDEKRVFDAGIGSVFEWRGVKLGILICEDMWSATAPMHLKEQGAELLLIINASPFEAGKRDARMQVANIVATETELPLYYVNQVGGQDDIVFDGGSFFITPSPLEGEGGVGGMVFLKEFEEDLKIILNTHPPNLPPQVGEENWCLWSAMKLGLGDYVRKNGFSIVLLGLSGGIDSALTATLAVDALGAANVKGVLLPSPYTSHESTEDALELAKNLGIETMTIPITAQMETFEEVLNPVFHDAGWMDEISIGGNLQSRLRGVTLMALSNKYGWMLLSTGNKSEIAVGYSTLYGDSCGSYNVLKDLYKTQVYQLANWRNAQSAVIPARSISKAPTAELAPNQKDSDQLPPYDVLDAILHHHIEGHMSAAEIIAQGFDKIVVEKVVRMVRQSEYKRRQSCPGVRLSSMLFGKDRRYPVTNKF
ncbi:MAG: NAD+ synthase [Alphaproteobacteria bacterium]